MSVCVSVCVCVGGRKRGRKRVAVDRWYCAGTVNSRSRPSVLAPGAGGIVFDIPFLSSSLWRTAQYRLTYCLKESLHPNQPTKPPSADSRRPVVSYWRKYVQEVMLNHLGGLSMPRKSVVRLTDRPGMTSAVYRGRNRKTQPTNQPFLYMYRKRSMG